MTSSHLSITENPYRLFFEIMGHRSGRAALQVTVVVALAALLIGCDQDSRNEPLADTGCYLTESVCEWPAEATDPEWRVRVSSHEGASRTLQMTVTAPEGFRESRMIAVWRGRDMYMGEYPMVLSKMDNGNGRVRYQTVATLPVCTVDPTMVWEIRLQGASEPIRPPVRLWYQDGKRPSSR